MMKPDTLEDTLKKMHPDLTQQKQNVDACVSFSCIGVFFFILYLVFSGSSAPTIRAHRDIKIISMDFTAEPNNNKSSTQYHLPLVSARWDLLIRLPGELVGNDICLQGNLQASFLYKNVTLVTSSIHSYDELELDTPQLLSVSAVASSEDLSGAIGKDIMEVIKERNELQFGSRLSLTDCREETKKGTMSYECDEAKLRFEQGSDQIKATAFGDHPTCIIKE